MAEVLGIRELETKLRALGDKYKAVTCTVGFTAYYAIFVHENMEAHHANGEAKYLENAARQGQKQIADAIAEAIRRGQPVEVAVYVGGLILQGLAQERCPVKTGHLRASAFTRLDVGRAA